MSDVVEEWEERATTALMQRGQRLGRQLTLATLGIALATTAAFGALCFVVVSADDARLAARGAILVFILALAGAHRASKAVMRTHVARWVDDLACEHHVPRETLAEVAKIFD